MPQRDSAERQPCASRAVARGDAWTQFSFGRGAAAFWASSAAGFLVYGYAVAALAIGGMGDLAPSGAREAAATALAVGLAAALALGAPAALVFAGVMRRVRGRAAWPAALGMSALLSAALYLPLTAFAQALFDGGASARELFIGLAAAAMTVGAVAGTLAGRARRR